MELNVFNLSNLLNSELVGEDKVKQILSTFSCPHNRDIEDFLINKSIDFSKKGLAATHLVFNSNQFLIGYFTLTLKTIKISEKAISNTLLKKVSKFGIKNNREYQIPAILIAQLGKNFTNDVNKTFSGDDLIIEAIKTIKKIQIDVGGKLTYIECEDKPKLVNFYEKNGFVKFDIRKLEDDEKEDFDGIKYLNQMLSYLS